MDMEPECNRGIDALHCLRAVHKQIEGVHIGVRVRMSRIVCRKKNKLLFRLEWHLRAQTTNVEPSMDSRGGGWEANRERRCEGENVHGTT